MQPKTTGCVPCSPSMYVVCVQVGMAVCAGQTPWQMAPWSMWCVQVASSVSSVVPCSPSAPRQPSLQSMSGASPSALSQ
jgi:hypothetical protein